MINKSNMISYVIKRILSLFGIPLYTQEDLEEAILVCLNPHAGSDNYTSAFNAAYYQDLHENEPVFQQNNWLLDDLGPITEKRPAVITELACGNGKFSRIIAGHCAHVYAIDWALAPGIDQLPANVTFLKKNIVTDDLPVSDLVCSGDFLEHLPTEALASTIQKIVKSAPLGYHKIACYDDGHSHLSILPPWQWLQYFQKADKSFRIRKIQFRRNELNQVVVIISNF